MILINNKTELAQPFMLSETNLKKISKSFPLKESGDA